MKCFILLIWILVSFPAYAQIIINGEEVFGEGPKGRYTRDQAEIIALMRVPGEVVSEDQEWENDHFYFEFTIQTRDKSVYEVEINSVTGQIHEIEVEYLSPLAKPPFEVLEKDLALAAAKSYVKNEIKGNFSVKVKKPPFLTVYKRTLVYESVMKKLATTYIVVMDAVSGKVLDVRKD